MRPRKDHVKDLNLDLPRQKWYNLKKEKYEADKLKLLKEMKDEKQMFFNHSFYMMQSQKK